MDENQFKMFEDFINDDTIVFSWDFDGEIFYVFEIDDWERIEGVMYVSTPFSNNFILENEFSTKKDFALFDLKKSIKELNWKKFLKCPVVFYSFTKKPLLLGKLKQIL